jgi:hypothetical protein
MAMGSLNIELPNITLGELHKLTKEGKYTNFIDNKPLKSPLYCSFISYTAVLIYI